MFFKKREIMFSSSLPCHHRKSIIHLAMGSIFKSRCLSSSLGRFRAMVDVRGGGRFATSGGMNDDVPPRTAMLSVDPLSLADAHHYPTNE
jgi:hypothetical protein